MTDNINQATVGAETQNQQGQNDNSQNIQLPKTAEELQMLLQREADRRVTQALQTAKQKWEEEFKQKLEEERREAERLAKLTQAEKEKELLRKQQEEIKKKEKEIALREMKLEAVKILNEKELPVEFVDLLTTEDAEQTKTNIEIFEKAFRDAVEKAVNERLKGATPKAGETKLPSSTEDFISIIRQNQVIKR